MSRSPSGRRGPVRNGYTAARRNYHIEALKHLYITSPELISVTKLAQRAEAFDEKGTRWPGCSEDNLRDHSEREGWPELRREWWEERSANALESVGKKYDEILARQLDEALLMGKLSAASIKQEIETRRAQKEPDLFMSEALAMKTAAWREVRGILTLLQSRDAPPVAVNIVIQGEVAHEVVAIAEEERRRLADSDAGEPPGYS